MHVHVHDQLAESIIFPPPQNPIHLLHELVCLKYLISCDNQVIIHR